MTSGTDSEEFRLHTAAVIVALQSGWTRAPAPKVGDDPWWLTGPHLEKDGRSDHVHAMGCFQSQLGQAMLDHPDWYLVPVIVSGKDVQ